MNTRFIASNLEEATEELHRLTARAKAGEEIPFEDFHVAMAHIYHHLNSAWNGRNITREEWQQCTDENYEKWQRFPQDLPLIGADDFYDLPEYRTKT
jgi:hypothetical protein